MKLAFYYFSGTGNTEIVVNKWAKEASKIGHECNVFNIENITDQDVFASDYDNICIAYPIHAFNAPEIVLKFVRKLYPSLIKRHLFIIMVSGEDMLINHSSSDKLSYILRRKNYFVESEYHYLMPYNIIFRHTEKRAFEMFDTMNKLVELDAIDYLVNHKKNTLKKHRFAKPFIALMRIEQVFSGRIGKSFKIDQSKCINCMKCIDNCPSKNIKLIDGKFVFSNRCIVCMRCSFNCPKDAFDLGLLKKWKVNGKYKFLVPEIEENDDHIQYCKKSYDRYFSEANQRINNHN